MKQKIAVFDVDGTLCKAHLGVEFLKEMAALDAIQGVDREAFGEQYQEWSESVDRTAYYDEHFDDYYTSRLVGVERSIFEEAGRKVAAHTFPSFYSDVLDEVRRHQQDGRFILIISKSPEQAVAEVAKLLNADDYWGWQFNFDASGRYVDQYTYPNGESDKAVIIQDKAKVRSLELEDSYAYGDSNGDISMLAFVTHPTAVNPEPKLLSVAQENAWRVMIAKE